MELLPWPGSLSTQMRPPIIWTRRIEMVSPSPVPPYLRVVEESAWVKAQRSISVSPAGIPMPVSRDSKMEHATFAFRR